MAPRVRQAFLKALKNLKDKGVITDMADLFEQIMAEDPAKAFEILAKFTPRELMIEENVTHRFIVGQSMSVDEWEKAHGIEHSEPPPVEHH